MADQSKYTQKLKGKKVLIIGGSAGIGYGVAEAVLEHGGSVIISSSNPQRVRDAAQKLESSYPSAKGKVLGYDCDLGQGDTLEKNIVDLLGKSGKVDHIVWTAGDKLAAIDIKVVTLDQVHNAGNVRFYGPLLLAKHAPKYLTGGPESSITLTTGAVSERPIPNWSIINSFATGLQGMTRGLALDLKPIRVNLVSPGVVDTPLWTTMGVSEEEKKKLFAGMEAHMPTGKAGQVEDVAESYLYLMKDKNITGSMISTNGGHLLVGPS